MTKPTKLLPTQSDQSSVCAQWVAKDLSFHHADSEDWSDWADAQDDLSLRWAHMPFCWFCHEAAQTFLVLWVLLHRVEKIPSVQSLVATSRRPNICGAVMAFGFILISLCGSPHSVIAFIRVWIHLVLPAPLGPRVIMPWRTRWVSNSWINFRIHGSWWMRPASCTYNANKITCYNAHRQNQTNRDTSIVLVIILKF